MKLNKTSDQALVILTHLAALKKRPVSAREIQQTLGLPHPTVRKVLGLLVSADILTSARGAHGGYHLANTPEEIPLIRILEVTESSMELVPCGDRRDPCCPSVPDSAMKSLQIIQQAMVHLLTSMTLHDLIKEEDFSLSLQWTHPSESEKNRTIIVHKEPHHA